MVISMGEIRRRVNTYSVDMLCPKCNSGNMRPRGGIVLMTSPPQYPHECENCGHVETFYQVYPRIEYEAVKADED